MSPTCIIFLAILLTACGDSVTSTAPEDTDVADTDPGDTDPVPECDTNNEDCSPGTCFGEGGRMLPGAPCISCHNRGSGLDVEGTFFTASGTIYSDADGAEKVNNAIIRVTDSEGKVVELSSNRAGNFFTSTALVRPLSAEVEVDGQVRAMNRTVDTGNCNTCHSCNGNAGAKIFVP